MSEYQKKMDMRRALRACDDAINQKKTITVFDTWQMVLLADSIETLLATYYEQLREISKLKAYKLDCDAAYKTYSKICDSYQDGYKQGYDDAIKDKENGTC